MAASVYWVQEIKGKEDTRSVLQHISKSCDNENYSNRKVLAMADVLHSTKSSLGTSNEFPRQSDEYNTLLQHPVEFCVEIYRKHCSKNPPFCNSIYGLTDQLISLQLVMAQKNKEISGDFEVDSQDVITTHQTLVQIKLSGLSPKDHEMSQLILDYDKFLAHCNAVDYADIINSVRQCFQSSDKNIQEMYQKQQIYIILGYPKTIIETEILLLLVGMRDVKLFSPSKGSSIMTNEKFKETLKNGCDSDKAISRKEVSRTEETKVPSTPTNPNKTKTDCQVTPQHQTGTNDRQVSVCLSGGHFPMLSQSPFSQGRQTMGHELSVLMSYLQLLLNSRDELALARVINTPDRDLGVRKFTKIKKLAREKNMTMYQMVTSFILQIRLGGKSYAPSDDNPLWLMTKGLSDFVSLTQKLQNILEEVADAKAAVSKILGNLQSTFNRTTNGSICKEDVRKATTHLKAQIDCVLNNNEQNEAKTEEPKQSMIGSESYILLRKLLDKNVLYDYQQKELLIELKTPKRKQGMTCSLLTKFRTPEAPTPEKVEFTENKQTNDDENSKLQVRQVRSVYGDMSWAKPAVTIETRTSIWSNSREDVINQEQTRRPCGIFNIDETPKASSRKRTFGDACESVNEKICSPQRKRPFESKDDQENVMPSVHGKDIAKSTAKRGLLCPQGKQPGNKKAPKASSAPKKKHKSVKLIQGQKQMTQFFR